MQHPLPIPFKYAPVFILDIPRLIIAEGLPPPSLFLSKFIYTHTLLLTTTSTLYYHYHHTHHYIIHMFPITPVTIKALYHVYESRQQPDL